MSRAKILVNGVVQGVGFRPFVYRTAVKNSLRGWVRNLGGAGVEIALEGEKNKIKSFLKKLKKNNPPLSEIKTISVTWGKERGLSDFKIKDSSQKKEGVGRIPPDTAICEKCLQEIKNDNKRFKDYWATSCVDCGPRFTVIESLPYDRDKTSMKEFPMCEKCREEYTDPLNRRYHAQTIACPNCGPQIELVPADTQEPIKEAANKIKENQVLAIKGTGGTHLACSTDKKTIKDLRSRLSRPYQPFALMVPNLDKLKEFAIVNKKEKQLLESIRRPIVVLRKKENNTLPNNLAPGLHTIGVMLPYSGLHNLLFDHINQPIIMTSANQPGIPMSIKNEEIKKKLKNVADFYLLHNRKIVSRCDDSVIRVQGNKKKFIRKSRGYSPSSVSVDFETEKEILALGAELDNTITLYDGEFCYTSQYIGDIDNLETFNYLKKSINHLKDITGTSEPKKVVSDLHPDFRTTKYAKKLSKNPIQVQHHHAHIASVLAEKGLKEDIIGIGIDGIGYGGDNNLWGGEVLLANRDQYTKLGGLSYQEMPGGDLATKYPARMIAGILYPEDNLKSFLKKYYFPHGEEEIENVLNQLNNSINVFKTSSTGRFLDAVSCMLKICEKRTYEGEPAMRLEKTARKGTARKMGLKYKKENSYLVLDTKDLLKKLIRFKDEFTRKDVAATAQSTIAKALAEIAIKKAEKNDIEKIALSGGVAYNDMITNQINKKIEENGKTLLMNEKAPLGDGGISLGQTVVASQKIKD